MVLSLLVDDLFLPVQPTAGGTPNASHTTASVSISSSGDNEVLAAVASTIFVVHELFIVAAGAVNVILKDGSTGLTGAMTMATASQIKVGGFVLTENTAFNVNLSGAVQVSGYIKYVSVT